MFEWETQLYSVSVQTRTPIWTAGVNPRRCYRIRETGILGSLRWWFGHIAQGYGFDAIRIDEFFGSTSVSRKFRFLILPLEEVKYCPEFAIPSAKSGGKRNIGGIIGRFRLFFFPMTLREFNSLELSLLSKTFGLIAKYVSIGGRVSQGCGVVQVLESDIPDNQKVDLSENIDKDLFHFWKIRLTFGITIETCIKQRVFRYAQKKEWKDCWKLGFLPLSPLIRDALRSYLRPSGMLSNLDERVATSIRHELMGYVPMRGCEGEKKGSKLFVSHGYKLNEKTLEVRVFGFFPTVTLVPLRYFSTDPRTRKPLYKRVGEPIKVRLSEFIPAIGRELRDIDFWDSRFITEQKGNVSSVNIVTDTSWRDVLLAL